MFYVSSKVGGWLQPQNVLSRHFEKYLHGMVLKLSGHVRNTISLLYKQKTGWNSDIWNFFSEKIDFFSNFGLFSLKIHFLSPAMFENVIVTSYVWPIFMILVSMERGDPIPYHADLPTLKNKNSYFDIQKFVFCTKKSYFLKLISQNAFWIFILYYMYFSYGKWMQEGLPNLTGSCHLAREWNTTQQKEQHKLDIFWQQIHTDGYIDTSLPPSFGVSYIDYRHDPPTTVQHRIPVPRPADKIPSFPRRILSDSGQNDDL